MSSTVKRTHSEIGKSNVRRSKAHERRIASLLTEWSGRQFRRRRVEGRDSTVIERESTADVIPVKDDAYFSIEAKAGAGFSLDAMLANPGGNKFALWWSQTCYDAQLVTEVLKKKHYPLLFFKPQKTFNWVAVSQYAFTDGILRFTDAAPAKRPLIAVDLWDSALEFNISHSKKNKDMVQVLLDPCYLMRWQDFNDFIDPDSFFRNPKPEPLPQT